MQFPLCFGIVWSDSGVARVNQWARTAVNRTSTHPQHEANEAYLLDGTSPAGYFGWWIMWHKTCVFPNVQCTSCVNNGTSRAVRAMKLILGTIFRSYFIVYVNKQAEKIANAHISYRDSNPTPTALVQKIKKDQWFPELLLVEILILLRAAPIVIQLGIQHLLRVLGILAEIRLLKMRKSDRKQTDLK